MLQNLRLASRTWTFVKSSVIVAAKPVTSLASALEALDPIVT